MKSSDEIKKGLYRPAETVEILRIRTGIIHDGDKLYRSALALIERLDKDCVDVESKATALYDRVKQLEKDKADLLEEQELNDFLRDKVKQLEAERDAAVSELVGTCEVCRWEETAKCASCHFCEYAWNAHESNWEWRGVQKEAAP